MASIISPNMSLIIPTTGKEPGPNYAEDVNASLTILDQHNHTPGSGVQIPPAGLNINTALPFNNNPATSLAASVYIAQSTWLTLQSVYVKGVDLYYRDGNNNEIQLTSGGSIVGTAGSITGLPSGTAGVNYAAGTYTFSAATNTPANIQGGSILLGNNVANSNYLTLSPPAAMAAPITETLPTVPSLTSLMTMNNSGAMGTNLPAPNSAGTLGQVYTSGGSSSAATFNSFSSFLATPQISVLTSGSTYTTPVGALYLKVKMVGGGGGGGGSGNGSNGLGAGGGAGGYLEALISGILSSTYSYSVGNAGAGGSGGSSGGVGGTGGTSTFNSSLDAFGGAGGGTSGGTNNLFPGPGNGGAATGGYLNVAGGWGQFGESVNDYAISQASLGGQGGASFFGGGGHGGINGRFTPQPGPAYGSGGGGGGQSQGAQGGAAGAAGVIIVEAYFQ